MRTCTLFLSCVPHATLALLAATPTDHHAPQRHSCVNIRPPERGRQGPERRTGSHTFLFLFHSALPLLQDKHVPSQIATAEQLLQYPNFCVGFLLADYIDLLDQGELMVHSDQNFMNERCGPHLFRAHPAFRNGNGSFRPWFGVQIVPSTLEAIVSAIAGENQFTLPPFIYYHKLRMQRNPSDRKQNPLWKLHLGCRKKNKCDLTVDKVRYQIPHNLCRSIFHCMAGTMDLNNQSFHSGCVGAVVTDGKFKITCRCFVGGGTGGKSLVMHNPTLSMCVTCIRT